MFELCELILYQFDVWLDKLSETGAKHQVNHQQVQMKLMTLRPLVQRLSAVSDDQKNLVNAVGKS